MCVCVCVCVCVCMCVCVCVCKRLFSVNMVTSYHIIILDDYELIIVMCICKWKKKSL